MWYKFNDEDVSPFDIKYMGDECFGGEETVYGNQPGTRPRYREKSRNAYMLFYQRKKATDATLMEANIVSKSKTGTKADGNETGGLPCSSKDAGTIKDIGNMLENKIVSPRSLCALQALSNAIIDDVHINSSTLARTSGPNDILLKIQNDNLCLLRNQF